MRLHSTLISSFLLVSSVLADNSAVGGVKLTSPNESTFETVETAVKVPDVSGQPFDSVSIFVSLDGEDCSTSGRVGINIEVGSDPTERTYVAWYQIPNLITGSFDASQIGQISPGNTLVFGLTAPYKNSANSVYVYVENADTGGAASEVLDSIHDVCGTEVEWKVSSIPSPADPTQYYDVCNFGTLELTSVKALDAMGNTYGPQGQTGLKVQENDMWYGNGTTVATITVGQDTIDFVYVYDQIP